jgi:hypothetical protein
MANPILFRRNGRRYVGHTLTNGKTIGYNARRACSRCGGAGYAEKWRHTGLTCFDCGGSGHRGTEFHPLYTAEKLAKLDAAQAKRDAAKAAKLAARQAAIAAVRESTRAAFEAQHGALLARAAHLTDAFVVDLVARARQTNALSEKQAALLVDACDRADARVIAAAKSSHVGSIGARIEVPVTVDRIASYERVAFGSYGVETVWITTLVDAAGNQLVVKSPRFHQEKGATFTLRATVKEHTVYQGAAQTVVQRPVAVGA